jgi:hypothetical protein
MAIHQDAKTGRHSRRVAAWIYTIINPIIDALRSEAELLGKGDLTWRCYSKRFEHIRPIREYIDPHYRPNFEDFLADNSEFAAKFENHDSTVSAAEEQARRFYEIIVASPIFIEQVKRNAQEYKSKVDPSNPYMPSLEPMGDDLPKYVAENLINSVGTLPQHYTIHRFWELFGQELRSEFEPYKGRQSFRALEEAVGKLRTASIALQADLERYRLHLCREFDLPAAQPVTPGRPADDLFS